MIIHQLFRRGFLCFVHPPPPPPAAIRALIHCERSLQVTKVSGETCIYCWGKTNNKIYILEENPVNEQSTYVCRVQSIVWRLPKYWPPSPFPPSECVLLPYQRRRGTHSPGGEGVGGSIFWKTPDIGLASYSIISLRVNGNVRTKFEQCRLRRLTRSKHHCA